MAEKAGRKRASSGITWAAATVLVFAIISAAGVSIVALQTISHNRAETSTLSSTQTSTLTSVSTVTVTTTLLPQSAQVAMTEAALLAPNFTTAGITTTFACATARSGAYLTLTNTGAGSTSVATVIITWAGTNNRFLPSGSCGIGAIGSAMATTYLIFPLTSKITQSAVVGQAYTCTINLSDGAQLFFTGTWQ